jgi:hypothetical protein
MQQSPTRLLFLAYFGNAFPIELEQHARMAEGWPDCWRKKRDGGTACAFVAVVIDMSNEFGCSLSWSGCASLAQLSPLVLFFIF